jgi:hypothetical protein
MMHHYQVALRWARGDVPRNGLKGHNVYCDQETIYSYGPHWPLATKRKGYILVNADKRSISTSRHQGYVQRALNHHAYVTASDHVPHAVTFTIPRAAWDDKKLAVQFYREKIVTDVARWDRARTYKPYRMNEAREDLSEFRRFCEFHKIDFDALLKRDTKLALSCAIIALNPGG